MLQSVPFAGARPPSAVVRRAGVTTRQGEGPRGHRGTVAVFWGCGLAGLEETRRAFLLCRSCPCGWALAPAHFTCLPDLPTKHLWSCVNAQDNSTCRSTCV